MPPPAAGTLAAVLSGTGTSVGVPMIGCSCPVCRSTDPRDRRRRSSVILRQSAGPVVVIDTGPDFREQMLTHGIDRLDAVLLTHEHADHISGLDDIRPFNFRSGRAVPVHGSAETLHWVRRRFDYIWEAVQAGGGLPRIEPHPESPGAVFPAAGLRVTPLPARHGVIGVWGYRIGDFAYLSDVSDIPPATLEQMRGLSTLVLGAVQFRPHRTHFHIEKALEHIRLLAPRRAYLTHLNHDVGHARHSPLLPENVRLAYDGLEIPIAGPWAVEAADGA